MFRLPWPTRKDASTPVALALQGGGAHGAYTWGVLDRLLEAGVPIEGISGTSAGAMNAVALAEGWTTGGAEGARAALDRFWTAVGDSVPFHLELLQSLSPSGDGSLPSPMNMMLGLARVFSPYQLNPFELNPLRDVVRAQFDFERIRRACPLKLFIAATAVRTGKVRLFRTAELGEAALLASACLPTLHHAVEIDGEHYWDGGFTANPAIYPLLYECDTPDLLMVLLNPLQHEQAPRSAEDIAARSMELGFSTTFLREMRMIAHARQFIAERPRWSPIGRLERKLLRERFHLIDAPELGDAGSASKLDATASALLRLRELGRARAETWLQAHAHEVGRRETIDVGALFL
ncbi:MAG TPA: patatin-like phospholipase family protein [Thauera aminoaromatica]|jgi:NTE family protein|uniref:Patatin n=2 Tax=Thauera aminoaromatica TaxID=164330 RepID=C4ZLD9_THASP|nr:MULTISPECIES: patatin-like phospholipase family protein [Thauera]OPZ04465.1 MAG: Patatin-like phospholipase [Alphaproteobacteria bacterium ADurb.BinA305]ACK53323.1 Patatin [Thauera aminoaromatica]KIN91355.1 patatin-like phospholipase family protein [Thauera sp. SWB20]HMX13482.1 patatin-like phospholipase family protein [Thauera aminoaromatica]HPV61864.1 patatin-like phospholipase family protein [Thauera aminoaromatica]